MTKPFSITHQVRHFLVVALLLMSSALVSAQTTTFTYQGRLQDTGTPANGSYDLQLTLWDATVGGTQQPQPSPVTVTRTSVLVTGGIFTVQLDFGASAFPGADRFLEIGVRPTGGGAFTTLSPRQQTTSTPYAVRSANATTADTATNATQLGSVAAGSYVQTSDARLSDSRAPTASSANYIQNNPASSQTNSSFNISGNGTAGGALSSNIINATTQYNIGGNRVLSLQGGNIYAGVDAGTRNTSGFGNSFFGLSAGSQNTAGSNNSFFGNGAGANNMRGGSNSFFGDSAGISSTGSGNTFVGVRAGQSNTSENNNTFIGFLANGAAGITNATAIGANASVTQSNSLVLGNNANVGIGTSTSLGARLNVYGTNVGVGGVCNAATIGFGAPIGQVCSSALQLTTDAPNQSNLIVASNSSGDFFTVSGNAAVGIGTVPLAKLDVRGDVFVGLTAVPDNTTTPGNNIYVADDGVGADSHNSFRIDSFSNNFYFVARSGANSTAGTGIIFRTATAGGGELDRVAIDQNGNMSVTGNVCAANISCASDARLKRNVAPLSYGLREVLRLRPVKWQWKDTTNVQPTLGLIAQEVEPVMPELVLRGSDAKEPLGLNYMGLIPVLVKGTQEQQAQIDEQRKQINQQQSQIKQAENQMKLQQNEIEALKKLVCLDHPGEDMCKRKD